MRIVLVVAMWSSFSAGAAVAGSPSPAPAPTFEPDVTFHADVRAETLRYDVVPARAGATVSGKNVRGNVYNVTNVPSPRPGTTYRRPHAIFHASTRFVDPNAAPNVRRTP